MHCRWGRGWREGEGGVLRGWVQGQGVQARSRDCRRMFRKVSIFTQLLAGTQGIESEAYITPLRSH